MYIYTQWQGIKKKHKNIVVGLGNFDGVHLGHRKLINELVAMAKELEGTPAVFTFHPHPMSVLSPGNCPPLLLSQEAKQKIMAELGIEVLLMVPFTEELASCPPEAFVKYILCEEMGVRGVVVGYNYTFGRGGVGTPALLEEMSRECGYKFLVIPPVEVDGLLVSSTLIRNLLQNGDVEGAGKLLGYSPFIEGYVVYGDGRGRVLGFPTANLEIDEDLIVPANGVYLACVHIEGTGNYLGLANIGIKPTFNVNKRNIEVHILDFYGDLYGKNIKVIFRRRLREETKFNSVNDLVEQIAKDVERAREEWLKIKE